MKINTDPMPILIAEAVARTNRKFDMNDAAMTLRERAWNHKREMAQKVVAGDETAADKWFVKEAELRGLTLTALSEKILSKPDYTEAFKMREFYRQKALLQVEQCKTKSELDAVEANMRVQYG